MVMIGYEEGSYCYRLYDPATKKLHISRDVVFEERRSWEWNKEGASMERTNVLSAPSSFTVAYEVNEAVTTGGAGGNPGTPQGAFTPAAALEPLTPVAATPAHNGWATPLEQDANLDSESGPRHYRRLDDLYNDTTEVEAEYSGLCLFAADEPTAVQEALGEACWKQAMDAEMAAILENKTWELTTLPAGQRAIGLKWVFKVKRDPAGNIVKHKARLIAKGYAQRQGVDFDEVFAPVTRMETVRLLLALAAHNGWQVHHMDVKSAFLNGDLAEEVYVHQPAGYEKKNKEGHVLRLRKALYGLRQAPRAWNAKLDMSLMSLGFERCPMEHAVYKRTAGDGYLLVGVYVDDLIITGSSVTDIAKFKDEMQRLFCMSDLGLLSYYLGIEVKQGDGEITIGQSSYAEKNLGDSWDEWL
jgi:hypothetical protein